MAAIFVPYKAKQIFTRAFDARQMAIIGVLLAVANSHFYWTIGLENGHCDFRESGNGHLTEYIALWIHICLGNLIPFVAMLVANSAIIAKVTFANHLRKVQLNVDNDKKLSGMTITLFSMTFTFLLTTVPIYVVNYIIKDKENTEQKQLVMAILNLLFYTNYSINFLLYCVSGTRFRREFFRIWSFQRGDKPCVQHSSLK